MTPTRNNEKILVVDENHGIYQLIAPNLTAESFSVSYISSAAEAAQTELTGYSLLIIDAMSQDFSGIDLVEKLKSDPKTMYIPLMLCTSNDSQDDIIRGFDAGVDDYIVKPFSIRELVARTKALLRRVRQYSAPQAQEAVSAPITGATTTLQSEPLRFCGLTIDPMRRTITRADGSQLSVTQTEYAILVLLISNLNKFFTREEIRNVVWSHKSEEVNDRTIDVNISRLRKKLGVVASHLVNKSGRGYAMMETL